MVDRREVIGSIAAMATASALPLPRAAAQAPRTSIAKYLWVYRGDDVADIISKCQLMGATGVVVWTAKPWLANSLKAFDGAGLRVWGWRRPAISQIASSTHYGAQDECSYVVDKLIGKGLSGYILDAEGRDSLGEADKPDNWNKDGAAAAARLFADKIKVAGKTSSADFVYGLTASCREPARNPHMPFADLIASADAVYPQCYWGPRSIVGRGRQSPAEAYQTAKADWAGRVPPGKPFLPIAGTLANATPAQLTQYGQVLRDASINEAHVWYYGSGSASDAKYRAIKSI